MTQQRSNTRKHNKTKALGSVSLLAFAVMGASSAQALQTDLGVDYEAKAYSIRSGAWTGNYTSDCPDITAPADCHFADARDNGLAQLLRVTANFKDEETGVSVHTRLELTGDRWQGDDLNYNTGADEAFNTDNRGPLVSLDLGYAQVPLPGKAILRIGRQESNWNNGFLVSDDRRDRILGIVPTTLGTVLAFYDRRGDQQGFFSNDNGDQVGLGFVTKLSEFKTGLLYVHWFNNNSGASQGYSVQGADIISPYITGSVADMFSLTTGFNWIGNNQIDQYNSTISYSDLGKDGLVYSDSSFSEYLRIEKAIGNLDLGIQFVGSQDGGLVSPGFDTWSSMINNNPESTANPTSLYRMGNAKGLKDYNESLFIGKVGYNFTPKFKVTGAAGSLNVDNGTNSDNSMVFDLQASYQVNKAVRVWATAGMIASNDVGKLTGNPLVDSGQQAVPVSTPLGTIKTAVPTPINGASFGNNSVSSGSLNLSVKF
ncbi:hypothetical protein ACFQGA_01115 [Marinobacter koreensis]|uniref:Uncharacterized protein n=1 Tax=Marinobacter koreensis TaxID=335974 RepID=A0ABW0RSV4_9GAMM|nr:hypothetical protein [Marinobacter koreensis]MCK7548798.1 hypothetical protein [Marinobacter koreensis]